MEVTFFVMAAGQLRWTAPSDGEISAIQVDNTGGTCVVSTIPDVDISQLANPPGSVDERFLAAAISTGTPFQVTRDFSTPILLGESIFVSADSVSVVHLRFVPSGIAT